MPRRSKATNSVHLLDGNVLYALIDQSHVHHTSARRWFLGNVDGFATCPITQGTLVRLVMRVGNQTIGQAIQLLATVTHHPHHHFWLDSLNYSQIRWNGVVGHRQVTDAYLAGLARKRGGKLATFDRGLVSLHADVAVALQV